MFSVILLFIQLIFSGSIAIICYRVMRTKKSPKNLPGPSPLPIIGNLHQAPTEFACRKYAQWSKEYGHIYQLRYGLTTLIIINSYDTAKELLDKRGSMYSSRPSMPMVGDCVTRGLYTTLMPYNSRFRKHQLIQQSYLSSRSCKNYIPLQEIESKQLLLDFLDSKSYAESFLRYASSLLFSLCYGKRINDSNSTEALEIQQIGHSFVQASRSGYWIVDAIPILNYIPSIFAPWKRFACTLYKFESTVHLRNMSAAEKRPGWNWCKKIHGLGEARNLSRTELAYHIGMVFSAGTETTVHTLNFFILAAVLHPDIMDQARDQLLATVGEDHIPQYHEIKKVPYIDALVKEILRWRPVTTLAIPHAVTEEDTYLGYRIPKGATVIGNTWALSQDDSILKDPHQFNPSRWIENPNLPVIGWGYGRRVCPGQFLATNSMRIIIARLLWAFRIEGVGNMPSDMEWTEGLSSGPLPFEAKFIPRSKYVSDIIRKECSGLDMDMEALLNRVGV